MVRVSASKWKLESKSRRRWRESVKITESKAIRRASAPRELVEYWVNSTNQVRQKWGRKINPGDVVVRNQHGAKWEMTAAEFDKVYQTGVQG